MSSQKGLGLGLGLVLVFGAAVWFGVGGMGGSEAGGVNGVQAVVQEWVAGWVGSIGACVGVIVSQVAAVLGVVAGKVVAVCGAASGIWASVVAVLHAFLPIFGIGLGLCVTGLVLVLWFGFLVLAGSC